MNSVLGAISIEQSYGQLNLNAFRLNGAILKIVEQDGLSCIFKRCQIGL